MSEKQIKKWVYYRELEIPLSEIMNQLDEDLIHYKNNEKIFGELATDFLKEIKELIEGWGTKFKELSAFHELHRAIEDVVEK